MKRTLSIQCVVALCAAFVAVAALAQDKKTNIVFIMGDDVGMWNIGAYHRGMMAGRTPNLDKLAKEGMLFTDYYAEASCTAGRANFITGELPIRTGMTTVGQAGAKTGLPAEACTIATALKAQGYATGQFGKNHLGDLNEFLHYKADVVIELGHAGFFFRPAILRVTHLLVLVREMRDDVHARRIEPAEERLAVLLGLLDETQGEIADLVVHRLHPFRIKRSSVLDLLFADLAPARHVSGVIRSGRPGMNHVAWADLVQ